MADKNDTFVLARRRKDGVEMVLGMMFLDQYPHVWEVIGKPSVPKKVVVKEEEKVEEPDISGEFNTVLGVTEPTTLEEYRSALDILGVEYKPQHGIPGLKKLYEEAKQEKE